MAWCCCDPHSRAPGAIGAGFRPWRSGVKACLVGMVGAIAVLGLVRGAAVAQAPAETPAAPPAGAPAADYYNFLRQFPSAYGLNSDFGQRAEIYGTREMISETTVTLPSLWWHQDQLPSRLGGYRLVRDWLAYGVRDTSIYAIDLSIDSQIWGVLTYYERYAVLNAFGAAAKSFGYNLRLYRGTGFAAQLVGVYACDFPPSPSPIYEDAIHSPGPSLEDISCKASIDLQRLVGVGRDGS